MQQTWSLRRRWSVASEFLVTVSQWRTSFNPSTFLASQWKKHEKTTGEKAFALQVVDIAWLCRISWLWVRPPLPYPGEHPPLYLQMNPKKRYPALGYDLQIPSASADQERELGITSKHGNLTRTALWCLKHVGHSYRFMLLIICWFQKDTMWRMGQFIDILSQKDYLYGS